MRKEVWIRADGKSWGERKRLVTTALESGADAVMLPGGDVESARKLGRIRIVSDVGGDLKLGVNVFQKTINSKDDEREVVKLGGRAEYVVVNAVDWKVIPLENIIAALQGKCKVIVEVSSVDEAKTALTTLEVGADGVLVNGGPEVAKKVKSAADEMSSEKLELVPVEVKTVKPVGMGDRVCVDTASMLSVGEGMLVGSQSGGLFLVHSESIETEYVASRPFRVNAGAVHAYVRVPDGKTKYLSELSAGDEVLAVNSRGESRRVVVGRMKIEKRPLMLVEAEHKGRVVKTLLQNAETILLVDEKGRPVSIARIKPGDRVMAFVEEHGRHFGMKVKESIEEK